jgi:hypothetical protein
MEHAIHQLLPSVFVIVCRRTEGIQNLRGSEAPNS